MGIARLVRHWFQRYGEPFQVGAQSFYGLFSPPPSELLEWLFSPAERANLPYPVWMLAHLPDVLLLPNDTFLWRDSTYRVFKALEYRIGTEPIYRLVIAGAAGDEPFPLSLSPS